MASDPKQPAFPHPSGAQGCEGMTLRDWFAGQAMAAMLTGVVGKLGTHIGAYVNGDCNAVIVDRAYTIADAMLAEKDRRDDN